MFRILSSRSVNSDPFNQFRQTITLQSVAHAPSIVLLLHVTDQPFVL